MQFHQSHVTGIRASQKEKDIRLLHRTCASGFDFWMKFDWNCELGEEFHEIMITFLGNEEHVEN